MLSKQKLNVFLTLLILIVAVSLVACKDDKKATLTNGREALGFLTNEDEEDTISQDAELNLSIVTNIDTGNKKITIMELATKDKEVLVYSGSTSITNQYDKQLTMEQIEIGEIVEADYEKGTQKLNTLTIADEAWEYTEVSDLNINTQSFIIEYNAKNYRFSSDTLNVFSNNLPIDLSELNKVDELTVRGVGNTIYSINVTKGHGYIKLQNADYFEGGIVEVGTKNIHLITKDMIIVAQEGDYMLTATKDGVGGSQNITVTRNEELTVDISSFQEQAVRIGSVKFTINPTGAVLYVDGKKTSYQDLVSLTYGTHIIKVVADGYDSYTESYLIDSIYINKEIALDVSDEESDTTQDSQEETTSSNKIMVNTPEGAMVYFDGVYKGIAPVSFAKESGSHTIVLSELGYENKSYTVYISSDDEDAQYSFSNLTKSTD